MGWQDAPLADQSGPTGGAIDLSRPKISNPDGSFSTERTITVESDGRHYLIPTIIGGKQNSDDAAIAMWQSGSNPAVGDFPTAQAADQAAKARSAKIGQVRGTSRWQDAPVVGTPAIASAATGSRVDQIPNDYAKPGAAVPPEASGIGERLQRGAGLAGRAITEGVTGFGRTIADVPANLWNLASDVPNSMGANVPRMTPPSANWPGAMDTIFPKPETGPERFAQAVGSGIAGAATGVGAGQAARGGGEVAKGVASTLAARPAAQAAAATGGGVAGQTAAELGAGPVGQMAASVAGAAATPGVGAGVKGQAGARDMAESGVRVTPGQILGGGWDRAEQMISKWPIVGGAVKAARGRALEDFGVATLNDALEPIGATVPKGLSGSKAVAKAYDVLGERYDDLLGKTKGSLDGQTAIGTSPGTPRLPAPSGAAPAGPTLRAELDNIKQMASSLPKQYADEISYIIDRDVIGRFQGGGVAGGETLKDIQNRLRTLADSKRRSETVYVRDQADALDEAKNAVDRMIARENPLHADELKAVDAAYGKFKIVQRAAADAGADAGVFSPAQFMRAVRAKDPTKDKRAFSEGEARSQPLAQTGKDVLGNTIPDSGTPAQLMLMHLLLGGGSGYFGGAPGLAAAATVPAMYSAPGVSAMQRMLLNPSGAPSARGPAMLNELLHGAPQGAPPQ